MKRRDVRQGRRLEPVAALERPWTMLHDLPKSVIGYIGQLLSRIGIHDLTLIEVVGSFGVGGPVEKLRCKRCGIVMTRRG
jgi:hypothetical protein